ncbi:MAG TPA: hypothetical protein VFK38_10630 [Candidatus Limnocylindrales bacterium]|nr:hypothetical protein [Candidatus Limnocylindrales bacterium]
MTSDLREEVRRRYAEAALAVAEARPADCCKPDVRDPARHG